MRIQVTFIQATFFYRSLKSLTVLALQQKWNLLGTDLAL